jgi:putative component of membrane protein insertase Oxa1/YidC/SpoIIIJ protein YidD
MQVLKIVDKILGRGVAVAIIGYQKTISPDHGLFKARYPYGYCPFHPSCSEYGRVAFKKHGLSRGMQLLFKRIVACRPGAVPTIDPVP